MKQLLVIIVFSNSLLSQELKPVSVWGGFGTGLAFIDYVFSNASTDYEVGIRYKSLSLKFNRFSSYRFYLFSRPDDARNTISSQSILVGYSHLLWQDNDDKSNLNLNAYVGYGNVHNLEQGIGKSGNSIPGEIQIEYRTSQYWGLTGGLYGNVNKFRNLIALNICLIIGYF